MSLPLKNIAGFGFPNEKSISYCTKLSRRERRVLERQENNKKK